MFFDNCWILLPYLGTFSLASDLADAQARLTRSSAHSLCRSDRFTFPDIAGGTLLDITAEPIFNFSSVSILPGTDVGARHTIDFCNVTIAYGHLGWDDVIHVFVWLPMMDWNKRILGVGGGGYSSTFGAVYQTAAVGNGFVATGTDAGHSAGLEDSSDPSSWALTSAGNSNYYLIDDFGSRSLGELGIIGKHVTEAFYGQLPRASYFTGCSGGGRQAFALAQRYPYAFDGLMACSPAISIESAIPAAYFAAQEMVNYGHYPSPCEVKAFTRAAIEFCDMLDGVKDDIISAPEHCTFSAYDVVGQTYTCNTTEHTFTEETARIVEAAWTGPKTNGFSWYPYKKDTDLTSAIITTECRNETQECTRVAATSVASGGLSPSGGTSKGDLLGSWFQYFLARDPNFDVEAMTVQEYYEYLRQSYSNWAQMLGAADPQLDPFRAAGGKLISWHGLADTILPPGGTSSYYDEVLRRDNRTMDFYRHFEAPGVGHCYGGNGPLPNSALQALIEWVENGTAPDVLIAYSAATGMERPLCPYPSRQIYTSGDPNSKSSFECTPL